MYMYVCNESLTVHIFTQHYYINLILYSERLRVQEDSDEGCLLQIITYIHVHVADCYFM